MTFNSIEFLAFFSIVCLIYYAISNIRIRNIFLLLSSYFFYMRYNVALIFLLFSMTLISYVIALIIDRYFAHKKTFLTLGIGFNLGILFVFKYFNFFVTTFKKVFTFWVNKELNFFELNLLLPLGISFYTFEIISYLVNVYYKKLPAERNFFDYALYISFFPQLLSGPIERPEHFIIQLKRKHYFTLQNFEKGFSLFLWGLFKKIVIADRLSIFVDEVFNNLEKYSGIMIGIASLAFTIQIYCDFSGYSEMAIGSAKILDFNLIENFNVPYFSKSIKEFWRRWHISLSTWFRDYVYIPLGGNRVSSLRAKINVFVTFLVSGLWHGANWTFVIWGGLHGIYQIIESVFCKKNKNNGKTCKGGVFGTFIAVTFAWIFFRVNNLTDIAYILKSFICIDLSNTKNEMISITSIGIDSYYIGVLVLSVLILFIADWSKNKAGEYWFLKKVGQWSFAVHSIVLFAFILLFGVYGPMFDAVSFIYFQF